MSLHGVCPIALTPFTDGGAVDFAGIDALTEHYLASGADGLTVLGIMGEAHKLTDAERSAVAGRYLAATDGEVPVVVGCSAPATRVTVERAREAEGLGAAAVMVAPPNNIKNLDLVFEHYREVAEAVSVPVVVQDEPVNTGVVMPAGFVSRVMNTVENCRYVKLEEAPTTIKISALINGIEDADKRAGIFGGLGGMYFYEELARGAIGIMTGFAYPEILVRVYQLFSRSRETEAREHFFRYLPLIRFEAQLGVGGVGIRKEVFKMRRIIDSSHVRSPAPPLDAETLRELEDLVEFLGLTEGDKG
jgi:4-hydroxy-tetrahydrodipicolinate synthase